MKTAVGSVANVCETARAAAEPGGEDEPQQVGVGGRVGEVVGVPAEREHPDRARHEVGVLVGVVGVGKALADAPQAQAEREEQHQREPQPHQRRTHARALRSAVRERTAGTGLPGPARDGAIHRAAASAPSAGESARHRGTRAGAPLEQLP